MFLFFFAVIFQISDFYYTSFFQCCVLLVDGAVGAEKI